MVPEEITPLVPAVVGEKVAEDQTCYILETLLKYMVIQVTNNTYDGKRLHLFLPDYRCVFVIMLMSFITG